MTWYFLVFFFLLFGQIFRIETNSGALMGLDISAVLLLISSFFLKKDYQEVVRNKTTFPLILFLISAALSLLVALTLFPFNEIAISSLYLLRLIVYAGLFFVVLNYLEKKKITINFLLIGLLSTGAGIALLGLFQLILYPDIRNLYYLGWDPHFGRLVSTTFDPNFTGIILVMTFLLGLNQFIKIRTINHKLLLFCFFTLIFIALVFTYSRSSYLSFLVGLSVWGMSRKKIKYFLLIAIFFIITIYIIPKPQGEGGKLTRTSTTSARLINWQESIALWYKRPLLGYGYNTISFAKEKFGLISKNQDEIPNHARAGVDNSLFFVLLTTGVIGLFFFLWFMWMIYKKAVSGKKIYLPIFGAALFHSFFQNTLFFPQVLVYLMFLLAIIEYECRSKRVENI